ncbi:D-isomer specific 2-hydroxyacid dehydrogenase [Syncephalastrum racemosum]|uniref:D-isomer specific 2-hydroxyacid dehydrogenase n=1 Tax=Syncephalastrum racemosum TaxID=13706 RepID=A0A1X2HFN7_SYNRA|nr:D-isomer specific 2-hydroxyacid dehydrogenase [Syncephalastrum racemosum]
MAGKPRALIIGAVQFATKELKELRTRYDVEYYSSKSREQFFDDCKTKYAGVVAAWLGYEALPTVGMYNKEFVEQLPESMKFLCYNAAGYDFLDVNACAARGIYVSHTPSAVDAATATVAATLILATCRNAIQSERNLHLGRFRNGVSMGMDPEGKKLGILGMGGIGKAVAKRMRGFDMEIQYHNRTRLPEEVEQKYAATYVDFETLLSTSDVLYVSVPLNAATRYLLDTTEFAMMKDGIIIVNTARGAVIRESSLVKALESGKVRAVGLDVFEEEPKVHPGLLSHPYSVLLPHIGTFTNETQHKMECLVLKNLEAALESSTLVTPVPEHKQYFKK